MCVIEEIALLVLKLNCALFMLACFRKKTRNTSSEEIWQPKKQRNTTKRINGSKSII